MNGSFELVLVLKATVLLAAACVAMRLLARRRPTIAAAVGNAFLVGLLSLPILAALAPRLPIVCLPAEAAAAPAVEAEPSIQPPGQRDDESRIEAPVASAAPFVGAAPSTPFEQSPFLRRTSFADADLNSPTPASVPASISPVVAGWAVYSLVAAFLLARLVVSWQQLSVLLSRTTPVADEDWLSRFEYWKQRLGVRGQAQLRCSAEVTVPFAAGSRSPTVVVPNSLLDAEPAARDSILVHELTHVARGDYSSQLLLCAAQAVYWFHPLAWLLGKELSAARERICDAWSVQQLGNTGAYTTTLIAVARRFVRRPQTALGMAMARTSRLGLRLAFIGAASPLRRCLPTRGVRFVLLCAAGALAACVGAVELVRATVAKADAVEQQTAVERRQDPMLKPGRGSVSLKVLEAETSRPIAGAVVRIFRDGERPTPYTETDAEGVASVALPKSDSLTVDVHSPGRIQQRYDQPALPLKSGAVVEVRLHKGTYSVGGRVVDESGRPVKGAMVRFDSYLNKSRRPAPGITELVCDIDVLTDADGKWAIDNLDGPPQNPGFKVVHSDFARFGRGFREARPTMDALTSKTAVTTLKRGISVEGTVLDVNGAPVTNAQLLADDFSFDDSPRCSTDAQGRYRFAALQSGRIQILVKAPGVGSDLVVIPNLTESRKLDIRLDEGRTVKGRVVDASGKPLANIYVSLTTGGQTPFHLSSISGADGEIEIKDAPPKALSVNASGTRYRRFERAFDVSKETSISITMHPTRKIHGSVVDADTGKPIADFMAASNITSDGRPASFGFNESFNRVQGKNGQYAIELTQDNYPVQVGAWAAGYQLARSDIFRITKDDYTIDLKLKKETRPKVAGVVLTPEGSPAGGAVVLLSKGSNVFWFVNDRMSHDFLTEAWRRTDDQGRFEFPPQDENFVLAAQHATGYMEGPPTSPNKTASQIGLKLLKWAKIEGTYHLDGKPSPNQEIRFYTASPKFLDGQPYTYGEFTTHTDAKGRFVLPHVPPLKGTLSRFVDFGRGGGTNQSIERDLTLSPGQTLRLDQAKIRGRVVVGRLDIPVSIRKQLEPLVTAGYRDAVRSDRPFIPYPSELANADNKTRSQWATDWLKTPASREYRLNLKHLLAWISEDGKFRLDGVEPDKYRMAMSFRTGTGELRTRGKVLGTVDFAFEVPEKDADYDSPIDLGVIPVKLTTQTRVGQAMPEISAVQLDGKPWKLSSHRGKVVVLDYWATWCGPCIAAIPALEALHNEYGDGVEFVSLSCDDKVETVKEFLAKKQGAGRQVFAGKEHPSIKALGIDGYPTFLLIDASGKLRWRGHDPNELAAQIPAARK